MVHDTEIRTTELCYCMYSMVPLVASWYIQIIFNPPITASGELVSCWIGPVTSIIIDMDKGMSLGFICSGFETYRYFRLWPLALFFCMVRVQTGPGNRWRIAHHRTFHVPVNPFHQHIFTSILTLFIFISTLQCLPMEITLIIAQMYMHHFGLWPLAHFPRVLWVQTVTATGEPFAHHSP